MIDYSEDRNFVLKSNPKGRYHETEFPIARDIQMKLWVALATRDLTFLKVRCATK